MIRFLWVYIERKKETIVGLEEEYVIGWMQQSAVTLQHKRDAGYCKTHFFACISFSRVGKNRKIKQPRKFSFPIKVLVNTSRTLGNAKLKCNEISTFQNCEIKIQGKQCFTVVQVIFWFEVDGARQKWTDV